MAKLQFVVSIALSALGLGQAAHCATFEEKCNALASNLQLPNVKVQFTQYVAAQTNLTLADYVRSSHLTKVNLFV